MKLKEYFDIASDTYPNAELADVVKILNRAIEDFSDRTKIVKSSYSIPTVVNKRWYSLHKDIIEILNVDIDGETAPKLIGEPSKRDLT
tara:strand:- start:72 stop:335 length:264 start_codon:yes stop_codon:yes gene_type:complete